MLGFIERLGREVAHNEMKVRAINEYQLGEHYSKIDVVSKALLEKEHSLRVQLNEVLKQRLEHVQEVYGDSDSFGE